MHAAIEAGGEPLDLLRRCVESLVPSYADGCELDLLADGHVHRLVAGREREAVARRERAKDVLSTPDHPIGEVLRGGPARLLDIDDPADERLFGSPDDPSTARSLGLVSAVVAPVVVNGRLVGALSLGRGRRRPRFDQADLRTAVDLARRIGLGWRNAVLLAERAALLASLHDGLVVLDADGTVLEVNERWCELTGFDVEASVGARIPYPWWPGMEDDPAADEETGLAAASRMPGGRIERRVELRRADGSRMPALVSVSPLVDRVGDRRAFVTTVKDLTGWEAAEADLASLQRVTARLAGAHDVAEVVDATLGEVLARTAADAAFLLRLSEDGQHVELVGRAGPLGDAVPDAGGFRIDNQVATNEAVRDGTTVSVRSAAELRDRFPDTVAAASEIGVESVLATPILHQGEAVGSVALWSTRPGAFDDGDARFLEAVAGQCGRALRRAEGYEVEHRASQALQSRLLSDVPILHERVTIATRYQAAGAGLAVGGDWYDVVPLGPERLAVVVGDVVGSGVDAAAVMGQLRSALKGIALVSPEPAAVLDALDRLARRTAGAMGATVCYAVVDLAAGELRFSRAGHPPPVLVSTEGARFLDGNADPPLGMGSRPRREAAAPFGGDDLLLLYTDGLVERRDAPLGDRLDLLRVAAGEARRDSVEAFVDEVIAACVGGVGLRDDLAVLALRDEPPGPGRFRAVVPALATELSPLRRELRAWLMDRGAADEVADDLVLATSEAATNAVEHAYRDIIGTRPLLSVVAAEAGGEVRVEVRDAGRWKSRPSRTSRGRGLAIARALLGEVQVRSGPSGTTVSFSAARTRAR